MSKELIGGGCDFRKTHIIIVQLNPFCYIPRLIQIAMLLLET